MRLLRMFVFLGVFAAGGFSAAPGVYAIVGGTVHRASGPPVQNGTVLIRGGLIEAVGTAIAIPADATVIDAKGLHVYPGLFDAQTSVGLPAPPPRRRPGQPQTPPREQESRAPLPSPAFVAAQTVKLDEEAMDARRSKGITTVLVASSADVFNGQSAILNLAGDSTGAMLLKTPASTQVSFNPRSNFVYPGSLMGVISYVRQTLLDAQQNELATAAYGRNPVGKERPVPSPDLEALRPALRRELPVVFVANDELMIRRAAEIAREFNLRWIVSGARQSYRMGDWLKQTGAPVLLSVDFPKPPAARREDQPVRIIRDRVLGPTAAAELEKRGVRYALVSGSAASSATFITGIRRAIEKGLDEEAALRAVTLAPAQIFGVDRQIGSLDRGKIANVFVTDKKFFERDAAVKHLLIDGRMITVREASAEDDKAESPIEGNWNLVIRGPEGEISIQLVLDVEGERLKGTYSGDRGSGDVSDGSVSGNDVTFAITTRTEPASETSDWRFDGTLSEGRLSGTVSTTLGTFEFTGSKPE